VMPKLVKDLLHCWIMKLEGFIARVFFFDRFLQLEFKMFFLLSLMWTLWKERNRQTFEGVGDAVVGIKSMFASTLFYWASLD
jgi:hypothetical protein